MKMNYPLILLAFLLLSSVAQGQTIVDAHGKLHVDGTKIKDECNRDVQLRGMSFFWHQWNNSHAYMNESVITHLKNDWKVQVVRIPIGGRSGDPCTSFGDQTVTPAFNASLKAQGRGCDDAILGKTGRQWGYEVAARSIRAAVSAGVYVIIDWHTHDLDVNRARSFFNQLSAEFGDVPNLIYQIYMEQKNTDWPALKAYSRDIIATIRANDPDNLILIPTPFYNQRLDLAAADPVTTDINGNSVTNAAYILHFYAGAHKEYVRGNAQTALDAGLAVFVAECGRTAVDFDKPTNPIDPASWNEWMSWADNNKISWASWSMGTKNETSSSLQPSASTDPLNNPWNYNNDLRSEGKYKRDFLRSINSIPSACDDGGGNPNPSTGNVTVRARGTTGSEQIEIRYNDQRVGDRITLSTTYQEYKVQVNNANGNFKVAFVNDNGPRDAEVDWLQVGTTKRQAETRSTNTAVWQNNSCGGSDSQLMNCNGYIGFGTMSDVTSGNVVIRARGNCGSETMVLEVGGSNVKTWNNLGTSYANYTYSGYSGGTIKVKFTNNQSSPCDRNLYLDYIEVCGKRIQSESSSVVQTSDWTNGDKQVLFTDGNNNYGNPGCGSARTSSTGTKLVAEPAASEWGEVFNLYPNPATDQLTVEGGDDYQVTLYDLTGRKVMQHDHLKGSLQLNISHVRPGLYVVKMRDGEQHEVRQRIVIE